MAKKENAAPAGTGDGAKDNAKGDSQPSAATQERQLQKVTPAMLSILTCGDGYRATKRWHSGPDGEPIREDFDAGKWFTHTAHQCGGIRDLHKLLTGLEGDPQSFIIRGIPSPGINPARVRRKKKPDADGIAWFADPPDGLPCFMADFDKVRVPRADLVNDPEAAVAALVAKLPDEFQDVTYHWQLSGSAGMGDPDIVRAHIWFCLDRPVTNEELVIWAEGIDADIDTTLFRTVQPHYTAAPIFDGVDDPLPRRSGLAEGKRTHVVFPEMDMPMANGSDGGPRVGLAALPGFEAKLRVLGDGPGLKGFNLVLPAAIAAYVYWAGEAGTDRQALKEDLRRHIDEAPRDPSRAVADIERYRSDDYLNEAIDSAIEEWGDREANMADVVGLLGPNSTTDDVRRVIRQIAGQDLDDLAVDALMQSIKTAVPGTSILTMRKIYKVARKDVLEARYQKQQTSSNKTTLERMNAKHAVVSDAGKTRVITFVRDTVLDRRTITRSTFTDFEDRYCNRMVTVSTPAGITQEPLGEWWLGHKNRRQYEGIVFAPERDTPGLLNLWQGWNVEAAPGDWSLLKAHMLDNLCCGDQGHYNFLHDWMATAVQHPGQQGEVAVVLKGPKGTGKGITAKCFGKIFGQHYLQISNAKHLVGNFNVHLQDCVLLFADEAFYAGDKQHESVLKTIITEDTLAIEPKGVDVRAARNCLHIVMASNKNWVVPTSMDERRFFVLDVANTKANDTAYFGALLAQMEAGGYGAMLHDLQEHDLTGFNVRKPPGTSGLSHQKIMSLDPLSEWWLGRLLDGAVVSWREEWRELEPKANLYNDYINTAQRSGVRTRAFETQFGMALKKLLPGDWPVPRRRGGNVRNFTDGREEDYHVPETWCWEFPKLNDCRKEFAKAMGLESWDDVEQAAARGAIEVIDEGLG